MPMKKLTTALVASLCLLPLAACSAAEPESATGAATSEAQSAAPQTIAALDYESAEVVASLGLAENLVLIPEAVLNPVLGGHVDELSEVPHTIPVAMELDAETVVDLAPELVIMSPRHGADEKIGDVLESAGIATLSLPDTWSTPASVGENIEIIGEHVGEKDAAAALSAEISNGLGEADETGTGPEVLILSNQAGRPFITAGEAMPLEILSRAGGRSVSDELGISVTGPISAEQVIEADPDGILLIDMNGSGDRLFAELLGNDAVASLDAVAHDRTMLVEGRSVQALGLTTMVDGLAEMTEWVETLD